MTDEVNRMEQKAAQASGPKSRCSPEQINIMLGLGGIELKQTRFYQDMYAAGYEEGFQKGLQEVRQVGRQEEAARLLKHLAQRHFGVLPAAAEATIDAAAIRAYSQLCAVLYDVKHLFPAHEVDGRL